ncbi:MAG: uncharacterized protein JWL88_176 [Parcubacteria group bacterium]|nr:uncharacterized protein [Parcubacteria group bacterium]
MLVTFLKIILVLIAIIFAGLLIRTQQLLWTSDQSQFSSGSIANIPDGLYAGTVVGPAVSWKGKKFDSASGTGINIFAEPNGADTQKYPFAFSVGRGLYDPIQVIRVDYDLPANPLWLRPVLDEVVEVAPDEYLGKLQLRIVPHYPFTITYFRLKKAR